ncbi:MAG: hypothetical protein WCF57_17915 [Pyrinomonadaceae bacterium]
MDQHDSLLRELRPLKEAAAGISEKVVKSLIFEKMEPPELPPPVEVNEELSGRVGLITGVAGNP